MSCPCPCENKQAFKDNCAHYTSDMMIKGDALTANPSGCYCCTSGRPVRAKELKAKFPGTAHKEPTSGNQYIYCERNKDGQGHVYYGTETTAVPPTWTWSGADRYEYYY